MTLPDFHTLSRLAPACLPVILAASLAFGPAGAGAATLVAQATPQEACSNLGGRIRGEYCLIDTVFCEAATLADEGICKGREGEVIDLTEIITGPRETAPSDRERGG